jgi:putative Holliday junction resolvase
VELFDERLSTRASHEILNVAGHPQKAREFVIDQVAAVVILEG